MSNQDPKTNIAVARRLQSIARNGLHYSRDPFDQERFAEIEAIAACLAELALCAQPGSVRSLYALQEGPATPKVDVRGLVLRGPTVLLVRDRRQELWSLPGGWAEVELTPRQSVERELLEETGFRVRTTRCLAIYDHRLNNDPTALFHIYKLVFQCEILDGEPTLSEEIDEIGFFSIERLPPLSTQRTTETQLRVLSARAGQDHAEVIFD
jgi:ADP-ribose pyrophosphatase YjhB (NUDIX family)